MKRCPTCHQLFSHESLKFCRSDGAVLVTASMAEAATILLSPKLSSGSLAKLLPETTSSVAVLPFTNLTADSATEYFCDGLAEELVFALSRIENLKVAARTSTFSFKGKNVDVRDIGRMLNVETVLGGSIRKSRERMRITVQLVSTSDGYQLWSERYDREMFDAFDVQDEITLSVVSALEVTLRDQEQAAILKRHTKNPKAYQLYLMGRFHANRFTSEGFRTGIEYLNSAIAEDPNYALAYVGLADAYYNASSVHLRPADALLEVKSAAERALQLDDSLAEAHTLLAVVAANYDRMPKEAEQGFKRALELAPNSVLAHQWYGLYLMYRGRLASAICEFSRARELDPLSPVLSVFTGATYFFARQPQKALKEARRALALDENFWFGHWIAALAHEQSGQLIEALAELEKAKALDSSPWITAVLPRVYAKLGSKEIAQKMLDQTAEKAATEWVAPYLVATAYFALDEKDRGFEWLERALEDYDEGLNFMAIDPVLDGLRSDPRFTDLLRRAGFTERDSKRPLSLSLSGKLLSGERAFDSAGLFHSWS